MGIDFEMFGESARVNLAIDTTADPLRIRITDGIKIFFVYSGCGYVV